MWFTIILLELSDQIRFDQNSQKNNIYNQWETLWPYKGLKHNVINSQSEN